MTLMAIFHGCMQIPRGWAKDIKHIYFFARLVEPFCAVPRPFPNPNWHYEQRKGPLRMGRRPARKKKKTYVGNLTYSQHVDISRILFCCDGHKSPASASYPVASKHDMFVPQNQIFTNKPPKTKRPHCWYST